ncbi:MAG: hypothetical protein HQK92_01350 [Nitrospirae bacterium]|nr:hypothetical protein [Nitrospirota bacterium]
MADERHKVVPKTVKLSDIKLTSDKEAPVRVPAKTKPKMTEELADWSKWIKDNPSKAAKIVRQWLESEEA